MYGGHIALSGQFKALVYIYTEWIYLSGVNDTVYEEDQKCTGSIISASWVLTAAHCMPDQYLYNRFYNETRYNITSITISVKAGCVSLRSKHCQHRYAGRFVTHWDAVRRVLSGDRGFWPGLDVAVLRMKTPFVFSDQLAPVALLGGPMPFKIHKCFAVGYGDQFETTTAAHAQTDGRLHYVPLTAGNHNYCRLVALRPQNAHKFHVCSHNDLDERQMTCEGDSGSPLVCEGRGHMVVLGVLLGSSSLESDNILCGDKEKADLYTGTTFVKKWIMETTLHDTIVFKKIRRE